MAENTLTQSVAHPLAGSPRGVVAVRCAVAGGAALLAAWIGYANFNKTAWAGLQGWGRPYWWLDYHHGFVRRGLVGQIFQTFAGRLDEAHLASPVTSINMVVCAVIALTALWLAFRAAVAQADPARLGIVIALSLWLAAGEVWPTLAYEQGYLDPIVMLLAITAALCVHRRWYVPAGVLLFVGPFVHEYFCFLVPFVLASERLARREPEATSDQAGLVSLEDAPEPSALPKRIIVLAAVAALAACIVMFAPAAQATRLEIAAMPLLPAEKTMLTNTTLTQTFSQSLEASTSQLLQNPAFTLRNALFFAGSSLLSSLALLFWGGWRPTVHHWARAAAALFPAAALLIAWDLSRLLVMTNITAGLLFLLTANDEPLTRPLLDARWGRMAGLGAAVVLGCAALAYALAPMAYVYYEPGPATLFPLKLWPGDGHSTWGYQRVWANARNALGN